MKETIYSRGGPPPLKRRSSVTRMSVDQKQNVIMKNAEEERVQLEAMRRKTLEEKDEEKKSESSTPDESSSDSETVNIKTGKSYVSHLKKNRQVTSVTLTSILKQASHMCV